MSVRSEFPRKVRVIPHEWIEMSDGCRLAARIWLPEDADENPVPAIFEYVPYRKNDGLVLRDAPIHHYFAGHGYASVRVDLRGSGDSDGVLEDEYLPLEQSDGVEVCRSLARQKWCSGRVGIIGKSWGGFNGLQIAALHPEELHAVISVASTEDRYADDVHYMGGTMLAWTAAPWASTMLAYNALPPDPAVVGEAWRELWLERLESTPPFLDAWLTHQRRDEFWRQGSVCEDFSAITCPVYMVGGWADSYRNPILRFLAGYEGPCKGLIGPWAHDYPEDGHPGPAIGFLQEAVRWWDRWLKDVENGIMDEPKLRVFMPDGFRPSEAAIEREGRYLALSGWPADEVETTRLALTTEVDERGGALHAAFDWSQPVALRSGEAPVSDLGQWGGHGDALDFAPDQRPEDGVSLLFESSPLRGDLELLGFPVATLELSCDKPVALVAIRLCDVWPDGASTLVTLGLKNLTHRSSDAEPEPLEAGKPYVVEVALNSIAYRFGAGHRLRLAVSSSYWPWAWPPPEEATITLIPSAASRLELPLVARACADSTPGHFVLPERAPMPAHELAPQWHERLVIRDVASGRAETVARAGAGHRLIEDGLDYHEEEEDRYRICDGEPLSAEVRCERLLRLGRGDWRTRVETHTTMTSTAESFLVTNVVEAYENDERIFAKTWHNSIGRDLV